MLGVPERSEFSSFVQNGHVGRNGAFLRMPQVRADLHDQCRHVIQQALGRKDLTGIDRQQIQETFEPARGQRPVLDAHAFRNDVAECGQNH